MTEEGTFFVKENLTYIDQLTNTAISMLIRDEDVVKAAPEHTIAAKFRFLTTGAFDQEIIVGLFGILGLSPVVIIRSYEENIGLGFSPRQPDFTKIAHDGTPKITDEIGE